MGGNQQAWQLHNLHTDLHGHDTSQPVVNVRGWKEQVLRSCPVVGLVILGPQQLCGRETRYLIGYLPSSRLHPWLKICFQKNQMHLAHNGKVVISFKCHKVQMSKRRRALLAYLIMVKELYQSVPQNIWQLLCFRGALKITPELSRPDDLIREDVYALAVYSTCEVAEWVLPLQPHLGAPCHAAAHWHLCSSRWFCCGQIPWLAWQLQ
jgi:hypothetical protein